MPIQTSSFEWEGVTIQVKRLTIRQARLERPSIIEKLVKSLGFANMEALNEHDPQVLGLCFSFANTVLQATPSKAVTWWCKADASIEDTRKAYEAFLDSDEPLYVLLAEHAELVNGVEPNPKNG